jgi:hypothetical protein
MSIKQKAKCILKKLKHDVLPVMNAALPITSNFTKILFVWEHHVPPLKRLNAGRSSHDVKDQDRDHRCRHHMGTLLIREIRKLHDDSDNFVVTFHGTVNEADELIAQYGGLQNHTALQLDADLLIIGSTTQERSFVTSSKPPVGGARFTEFFSSDVFAEKLNMTMFQLATGAAHRWRHRLHELDPLQIQERAEVGVHVQAREENREQQPRSLVINLFSRRRVPPLRNHKP